jgi:hypothetical protein
MRKSTKICVFFLLFLIVPIQVNGQTWVDSTFQFSIGDKDFNPRFPVYSDLITSFEYEYFVFERHESQNSSKVLIRKIDGHGPVGNELELSETNSKNVKPVIAYNNTSFSYSSTPKYILVVWQTNKNGSEDIYGKYNINGTWSGEFAIDSTIQNSTSPEIVCKDSITFLITYEKEGDIYYRDFNILTTNMSAPQNLTLTDTIHCQRPFIAIFGSYGNHDSLAIISYERKFTPDSVAINYVINSNGTWSPSGTITAIGLNRNNGFLIQSFFSVGIIAAFERTDGNSSNVYSSLVKVTGANSPEVVSYPQEGYSFTNLVGGRPYIVRGETLSIYGFIQDDSFDKHAYFYDFIPSTIEPDLNIQITPEFSFDTISTTITASHSLGKSIPNGSCSVYWFLFNKSEANQFQSRIYGIKFKSCYFVNITPISSEIPNSFSLKQNYPNPFNPATKIRFDIPGRVKQVKLSVYNSIGQEVGVLIDEQLQPGVYEYDFNASSYPSGVYFYRLEAGEFSETKRMVLVK